MAEIHNLPGIYKYQHLPLLAKFILDEHVTEFSLLQLRLSRQYNVPLLSFLTHYSDDQLIEITRNSVFEILDYLAHNKAAEQIESSLQKWVSDQMEIVGKYDIVAEDITLLNHVRGKILKEFGTRFYTECDSRYELFNEIDDFLLASTTAAANTFIAMLKDRIDEEEQFRLKLSNAFPAFIYVFDVKENREIYSNNKLKEILHYPEQQLKEHSKNFYQSITYPGDWSTIFEHRNKPAKNNGDVSLFEFRIKDRRGDYKWIRNYETSLGNNGEREPGRIIGVAFDVTGEKAITQALAIREKQLLEAQSIAHIGSFEWDITGQKSTTNTPEIYNIFEMGQMQKFEEFMQHVHTEDIQRVEEALRHSFISGEYECIYRYLRNGHEKIIWSRGMVTIERGIPLKMVGTVQDVTAIKRIEAELKEKTIELEKSNESLQQFASIASHDLKEPLRKIAVFSSKILSEENDKLSGSSRTALNKIIESTRRMQQMISDILQFSFIGANGQKEETDLELILSEVKEMLSESISDKHATVLSDGLPPALVIAPQIRQLFQNLLANALKFSKENEAPEIEVSHLYLFDRVAASTEKKQLEICIADNGIGFHEKDQENIFGLFYRLHNRSKFEGNGLGLSICKKIVENHGGTITAQSAPGEGSRFRIVLPL